MDKGIGSGVHNMERGARVPTTPPQFTQLRRLAAASPNKTGKKHPGKAILAGEYKNESNLSTTLFGNATVEPTLKDIPEIRTFP